MGGDGGYLHARVEREAERQRKMVREGVNRSTRRLLEDAGIGAGMRVLELGSGAGEVTLTAAGLVGPTGSVVGIEANPNLVESVRERARQARLTNVRFIIGDMRT